MSGGSVGVIMRSDCYKSRNIGPEIKLLWKCKGVRLIIGKKRGANQEMKNVSVKSSVIFQGLVKVIINANEEINVN
jgi:hypothetical protein